MAQSSEYKLSKRFDQHVEITGNLTVGGTLSGGTDTNYYLDGITKSGNTLTFSVNGTTNQTYTFGSNAFTSYTDHSTQGYLTSFDITTQTDPKYLRSNEDDTATGNITLSKDTPTLKLHDTGTSSPNYPQIRFTTANAQGVKFQHNVFDSELPTAGYGLILTGDDDNTQFGTTGTLSFVVHGNIYAGGTTNSTVSRVLTTADEGSGNGLDADTLDGYHASSFFTQNNDGSGSGLDADLLDGNHGTYFDHRRYTDSNNYLGGYYVSGGTEKPNSSAFGAGKLKIAMLRGGSGQNLGFSGTWNDVLWISTYTGGDVKRSSALVFDKYDNTSMYIVKQNYDATDWGTGYLFWNSGNDGSGSGLDADTVDGYHASSFFINGDTVLNMANDDGLVYNDTNNLMYVKADGSDYAILDSRGGTVSGQITASGGINMNNTNLSNVNHITINDSGAGEGIQWNGGSGWQIYESPDTMTNASGNLQFTTGTTFRFRVDTSGNTFSSSSSRAPVFYDSNNTGYYIHGDDTSRLNVLNVNAVGTSVAGIGKVMFPYGAEYSGSGTVTGAFKITLPVSWTNTMMTMKITIFNYSINESFEVHCGGYNYTGDGGYWVNTHAKIIANGESNRNFNVRFGHDGSKCCILIGETSSSWAYPKVVVTEWIGGHSNETFSNWDNGWDISVVTTLPSNIDQTRSNNQIGRYQSITYDTGNTNYYSDPASISNFNDLRFLNYLRGNGQIVAQCTDSYLRINQSGQFSNGIWFGDSHLKQGSDRYIGIGGNGGTTSSRVWLYGGTYTGTNVIKIDGSTGIIQTTTDSMRAPIFYDYDNTAYYVDPANTSMSAKLAGRMELIGTAPVIEMNDSNATNTTDQVAYISYQINGTESGYVGFGSSGNSHFYIRNTNGIIYNNGSYTLNAGSSRAPIFYDSDNTSYYLDAGSTSKLNQVDANYLDVVANNAYGVRFWGGSANYKIAMSTSADTANGGRVAGESTSDYNMYFTMSAGTNRGFVFRNANSSSGCIAGIDASGNGRFAGDLIAYASSDKRLKDNITSIENALDKVQHISGVTFDWNDKQDTYKHGKHDVGVIAQEIEEVLPEVVDTRENGYKAVKYEKIVPLLIEAIKELSNKVQELENKLNGTEL